MNIKFYENISEDGRKMIRPEPLSPGDQAALIAPSFHTSRKKLDDAVRSVEMLGLVPVVFPSCISKYDYLAGEDNLRAEDVMKAFSDPLIRAVFCLRGGYGAARILDLIDYEVIRKNPKVFVGFSDITALHTAINQRCGLITYHGPMPTASYHSLDKEISLASLNHWLFDKQPVHEIQWKEAKILNRGRIQKINCGTEKLIHNAARCLDDRRKCDGANDVIEMHTGHSAGKAGAEDARAVMHERVPGAARICAGQPDRKTGAEDARAVMHEHILGAARVCAGQPDRKAGAEDARTVMHEHILGAARVCAGQPDRKTGALMSGRLCGGNLTVLAAALGTPYEIETAGKILFLEDVGERTYRIDRTVTALRLAGRLQACSGILLGTFEGCTPDPGGRTCEQIIREIAEPFGIPVLSRLPCGHSKPNMTLPLGAWCEILKIRKADLITKLHTICNMSLSFYPQKLINGNIQYHRQISQFIISNHPLSCLNLANCSLRHIQTFELQLYSHIFL